MSKLRVLGALAALLLGVTAHADIIGSIWENNSTGAHNATPANVPATPPDVTFDIAGTSINLASGGAYTIGEFLTSGGATITNGAGHAGDTMLNTIFNFTGTVSVTNGETFTAGHDDGLTFIIDGIKVIDDPGPTGFTNTTETYTGPTGNFAFQLVYGECCGAPADLSISGLQLVSAPEPSSIVLTFTILLGAVFVIKKRIAEAA